MENVDLDRVLTERDVVSRLVDSSAAGLTPGCVELIGGQRALDLGAYRSPAGLDGQRPPGLAGFADTDRHRSVDRKIPLTQLDAGTAERRRLNKRVLAFTLDRVRGESGAQRVVALVRELRNAARGELRTIGASELHVGLGATRECTGRFRVHRGGETKRSSPEVILLCTGQASRLLDGLLAAVAVGVLLQPLDQDGQVVVVAKHFGQAVDGAPRGPRTLGADASISRIWYHSCFTALRHSWTPRSVGSAQTRPRAR